MGRRRLYRERKLANVGRQAFGELWSGGHECMKVSCVCRISCCCISCMNQPAASISRISAVEILIDGSNRVLFNPQGELLANAYIIWYLAGGPCFQWVIRSSSKQQELLLVLLKSRLQPAHLLWGPAKRAQAWRLLDPSSLPKPQGSAGDLFKPARQNQAQYLSVSNRLNII